MKCFYFRYLKAFRIGYDNVGEEEMVGVLSHSESPFTHLRDCDEAAARTSGTHWRHTTGLRLPSLAAVSP